MITNGRNGNPYLENSNYIERSMQSKALPYFSIELLLSAWICTADPELLAFTSDTLQTLKSQLKT